MGLYSSRSWEAIQENENIAEEKHTSSKVQHHRGAYLEVLVGFEGPDGGVSELDVVQTLVRGVFVDLATGEPIPMLLSQRCHFYN